MEVVLSWKRLFSARAWHSIFYSGAITCFVYPSANRTLLLQERTGHLGAQPVETHVKPNCFSSSLFFCFDRHFKFSRGLPLYTCSQTPVPGFPFPVPRSPFPVPRSPFPVPRSPFPVPRSPFPVPGISNIPTVLSSSKSQRKFVNLFVDGFFSGIDFCVILVIYERLNHRCVSWKVYLSMSCSR